MSSVSACGSLQLVRIGKTSTWICYAKFEAHQHSFHIFFIGESSKFSRPSFAQVHSFHWPMPILGELKETKYELKVRVHLLSSLPSKSAFLHTCLLSLSEGLKM